MAISLVGRARRKLHSQIEWRGGLCVYGSNNKLTHLEQRTNDRAGTYLHKTHEPIILWQLSCHAHSLCSSVSWKDKDIKIDSHFMKRKYNRMKLSHHLSTLISARRFTNQISQVVLKLCVISWIPIIFVKQLGEQCYEHKDLNVNNIKSLRIILYRWIIT